MKKKLSQQKLKELFRSLEIANQNHRSIYPSSLFQPLNSRARLKVTGSGA